MNQNDPGAQGGFPPAGFGGGSAPQPQPGLPGSGAVPGPLVAPGPGGGNPFPPEDIEAGKVWALLGYLIGPLWIVPLVQRDNAFALYHAKQALGFTIAIVVASIPLAIIATLTCGIGAILYLPLLYPWVMGLLYAAQGEYRPLPWFGFIADRYLQGIQADKRPGGPTV